MTPAATIAITVVGSVNLDLVARGSRLPLPGETVTGATFACHPGGKGANQALAAQRLGAAVRLIAAVGRDSAADEAMTLLHSGGVDLQHCWHDDRQPTGVALVSVATGGENQIMVAPGANACLTPPRLPDDLGASVICQLEVPLETVCAVAARQPEFLCLNLAPAQPLPHATLATASLIVVNETEAAFFGTELDHCPGLIATTHGARGATLHQHGCQIATALPPTVAVLDTTGAGDAFVAALTLALLEGQPADVALHFACAAGAFATTRHGAQPALPTRREVLELLGRP